MTGVFSYSVLIDYDGWKASYCLETPSTTPFWYAHICLVFLIVLKIEIVIVNNLLFLRHTGLRVYKSNIVPKFKQLYFPFAMLNNVCLCHVPTLW